MILFQIRFKGLKSHKAWFLVSTMLYLFWPTINTSTQKPYLWVYWDNLTNTPTPGYISLCRKSLIKHCTNSFTIVELNHKTIYNYLPELKDREQLFDLTQLNIAQRVDYYRVLLLHKFGGLYLDSDMLVMQDLTPITQKLIEYDYVGFGDYHKQKKQRIGNPENWAMASRPGGVFISKLLAAMEEELLIKKTFNYHDLGKVLLSKVLKKLKKTESYEYYHYENNIDGTKEASGKMITMDMMFSSKEIIYDHPEQILFITLYGSAMDDDIKMLTEEQLLKANINFARLVKISLQ